MNILHFPVLLLAFFCLFSCGKKAVSASNKGFDTITFGSGGGFTGMVKSYRIDKDGNMTSLMDRKKSGTITGKEKKELLKKIHEASAFSTEFDHPGNFYYFIEVKKNSTTNRITWSDQNKAPEKIISLYNFLTELTKLHLQ